MCKMCSVTGLLKIVFLKIVNHICTIIISVQCYVTFPIFWKYSLLSDDGLMQVMNSTFCGYRWFAAQWYYVHKTYFWENCKDTKVVCPVMWRYDIYAFDTGTYCDYYGQNHDTLQ